MCFQEECFRILPKEFETVSTGPGGYKSDKTALPTHSSKNPVFLSFFYRFGEHGVGEGWSGWVLMPMHLPSFPRPPHHPPQPLPLFSATISSPMEKMLSHISHFQCVGVADSGMKIWTIKPPDSFRVRPWRGDMVLEEGLSARGAWGRVLQTVALGRRMERGKGSFILPQLGC